MALSRIKPLDSIVLIFNSEVTTMPSRLYFCKCQIEIYTMASGCMSYQHTWCCQSTNIQLNINGYNHTTINANANSASRQQEHNDHSRHPPNKWKPKEGIAETGKRAQMLFGPRWVFFFIFLCVVTTNQSYVGLFCIEHPLSHSRATTHPSLAQNMSGRGDSSLLLPTTPLPPFLTQNVRWKGFCHYLATCGDHITWPKWTISRP